LLWWAAATQDGISVARLGNEVGRSLCIGFGSAATPYRCVETIKRAMANVPKLTGFIHLGITRVGHNRLRVIHNPKLLGIAVSSRDKDVRMAVLPNLSPESIVTFAQANVGSESTILTSGWSGYNRLTDAGFHHEVTFPAAETKESAFIVDYRLEGMIARLNEWLAGVGWEAIDKRNLPGYLAEFAFRYSCAHRGGNTGLRFTRLTRMLLGTPGLDRWT
jgi:hypothetical protein